MPCEHRRRTYSAPQQCLDCGETLPGGIDVMTTEEYVAKLRARGLSEERIAGLLRDLAAKQKPS